MTLKKVELAGGGLVEFMQSEPDDLAPVVKRRYSRLEFMNALTDGVLLEIIASTDPVIKLIEKRFDAASVIDTRDSNTVKALDILLASGEVPSFDQELRDSF